MARTRLSPQDQFLLLATADSIAEAERVKATWTSKSKRTQCANLGRVAVAAARLSKEISEAFPPPWTDDLVQIGVLLAKLGAFIEGVFTATMQVRELAVTSARAWVRIMKQNRPANRRVYWELIQNLTWLASGKRGAPISERTVRRYSQPSTSPRSPLRRYWQRNIRLIIETLQLCPYQTPAPPDRVYSPRYGPPRIVQFIPTRRQRKAIQAFTEIAEQCIERSNPPNRNAKKAARKRN